MRRVGNEPPRGCGFRIVGRSTRDMTTNTAHSSTAALLGWTLAALASGCGDPAPATPSDSSVLNGCAESDFVDRTARTAERAIGFGGEGGSGPFDYSPRCLTIASGQTVTFSGTFNAHPLSPGTAPETRSAGSASNPIARTSTGSTLAVTFPTTGTYPYFCEFHYRGGMVGVVRVR